MSASKFVHNFMTESEIKLLFFCIKILRQFCYTAQLTTYSIDLHVFSRPFD